jgi:hypothetical protein
MAGAWDEYFMKRLCHQLPAYAYPDAYAASGLTRLDTLQRGKPEWRRAMAQLAISCSKRGAKNGHHWCFVMEDENLTVLDCKYMGKDRKGQDTYSCEDVTERRIPRS